MTMGSTERRIQCLKIAAAMTRRMSKEDPVTDAETLMLYAAKLEQFAWHGEFADKSQAEAYQKALEQMIEVIREGKTST